MKKKILFLTLLLVLIFTTSAFAIDITIDGEKVIFDSATGEPFVDENYRTQVPLRITMESFGATINWDNENRIASVKKYGIEVKVPVNEVSMERPYIFINDKEVDIDTSAVIKNGRVYLPIRSIVEAFGATIEWDSENDTVIIDRTSPEKEEIDEDIISYEEFRDMFNYEASYDSFVRIEAKYNGSMKKSEFKDFWENMNDKTKELYFINIAKEKQLKNPQYMVNVLFYYYDKTDRYLHLGLSKADNLKDASAYIMNPFETIILNPVD